MGDNMGVDLNSYTREMIKMCCSYEALLEIVMNL